ncbi:MAG: hypothetical protein Q8O24_07535 [Gallionellaceae bacterium]|nr:hypothetical protein [Gallionellaceae bacterium]
MLKSSIEKLRIDVVSGEESALSLLISRDGTLGRHGSGVLPADSTSVLGKTDGQIFTALIELLDEQVLAYAEVYDHPNKAGIPITCSIVFQGGDATEVAIFEFRFGSETPDVGELLPYFDTFIAQAISLTDAWYEIEKMKLEKPLQH